MVEKILFLRAVGEMDVEVVSDCDFSITVGKYVWLKTGQTFTSRNHALIVVSGRCHGLE